MLSSRQYDLVLTDLVMDEVDGMQILRQAQQINPFVAVVVFTGHATIETAVEALKRGAVDYLVKPLNIEGLRVRVERALEHQELVRVVVLVLGRANLLSSNTPDLLFEQIRGLQDQGQLLFLVLVLEAQNLLKE